MIVAAQLYIFTRLPDLEARTPEILDGLAAAGYEGVEGMYGRPPHHAHELAPSGLRYLAPHVGLAQLQPLDTIVAFCREMGAQDVVSSGLLQWDKRSADDYRAAARALNDLGGKLRAEGPRLHYHNHDFEFQPVQGEKTGMALLLEGLNLDVVTLCLDVGWVWVAGADPVQFLRERGEPVRFVHLRDFRGRESMPLGQGEMDLAPVVAAVQDLPNLLALLVEQDPTTPDPLADMRASRQYLRDTFSL